MTEFYRFPHTPHLAWLASGTPRNDKILASEDVDELLSHPVVVEEKVDGANLGFSTDENGELRAQNRGTYLDLQAPQGQWKPLKRWLAPRARALAEALSPPCILFGEWCYAVHSVHYTHLPDWFLAFDVFDRQTGQFWSVERRNDLARRVNIEVVPELGRGHFDVPKLRQLLGKSQLTDGPAEGLYVRRESQGQLLARAKLVRAEFVQAIEEHWSKRSLVENRLDETRRRDPWGR